MTIACPALAVYAFVYDFPLPLYLIVSTEFSLSYRYMTYMRVYMYISESSSQAQFLLNWDTNPHIVETAYLFTRIRVEGALIPPESFSVADAGEGGLGGQDQTKARKVEKKKLRPPPSPLSEGWILHWCFQRMRPWAASLGFVRMKGRPVAVL